MLTGVVIKKSKISGLGVFANKYFAKGETVVVWHPQKLTEKQLSKIDSAEKHFVYKVDSGYLFMQKPERYVNHSCDANTMAIDQKDVAIRGIKKGEEITGDYSNDGIVKFRCNCGSKNCRGLVS